MATVHFPLYLCRDLPHSKVSDVGLVSGHDCGHGSFSHCELLNDVVGQVWHAFLMTPYYMWKLSHKQHHKFNANFDKDEVRTPVHVH